MSHSVEFSVVIPTYNRLDLLKRAVSSVWAQTHTGYEIIVADDGSTDGTVEWLASQGERVRAITQTNRGPGAARNLGTREARGEDGAVLDRRHLVPPWAPESLAAAV